MADVSGADGELIERLMGIIDHQPESRPHWWLDLSGAVADAIGGCGDIAPQSDRAPVDGTISWEHRGHREIVARVTWMNRLRLRLAELVGDGLAEDFLVVSLREHLRRTIEAPAAKPRSRYDEWIAEQATGGDNLELSLVARALIGPGDADGTTPGADPVWSAVSASVSDEVVDAWCRARLASTAT